jgi:hypothetical protein
MNPELKGNYRDPAEVPFRYVPKRSGENSENARIADVPAEIRT